MHPSVLDIPGSMETRSGEEKTREQHISSQTRMLIHELDNIDSERRVDSEFYRLKLERKALVF